MPCSHWRRAFGYARAEDWTYGAGMAAVGPAFMLMTERYAPSFSGRHAFPMAFRLGCAVGIIAGFGLVYQRSCRTSHPVEEKCKGLARVYTNNEFGHSEI